MKRLLPKTSKNPQGFTLIELMVAIAIVAILSAVGLVAFSSVQKNSRDARRRVELQTIASAIEAAKSQEDGLYKFTALSNEFPGNSNASVGTDPTGNVYCVGISTTTALPTEAAVMTGSNTCTAGTGSTLAAAIQTIAPIGVLATTPATAKSWRVCTYLEASSKVWCISSKTQ